MSRWLANELCNYKDSSLMGFWPFMGDLFDYSFAGAHTANINSVGTPVSLSRLLGRNCLQVKQDNVYYQANTARLSNSTDFDLGFSPFTISLWFCKFSTSQMGLLAKATKYASQINGFCLYVDANTNDDAIVFCIGGPFSSGGSLLTVNGYYSTNTRYASWKHLVVTGDGTGRAAGIKIYIDGKPVSLLTSTSDTLTSSPNPGGYMTAGGVLYFYGYQTVPSDASISLLKVFRRVLSPQEVANNYQREINAFTFKEKVYSKGLPNLAMPLFLQVVEGSESGIPLVLFNNGVPEEIPLFINGVTPFSGNIPLNMTGANTYSGIPLFIEGRIFQTAPLHTIGYGDDTDDNIPLYVYGGSESGNYGNIPLYITSDRSASTSGCLNLFLSVVGQGDKTRSLNMFMLVNENYLGAVENSVPLYLYNQGVGTGVPLYIRAPGDLDGGLSCSGSLLLFINRANDGNAIPLYMHGPGTGCTNNIPMYISSSVSLTGTIPLSMGYTQDSGVKAMPTYIRGY